MIAARIVEALSDQADATEDFTASTPTSDDSRPGWGVTSSETALAVVRKRNPAGNERLRAHRWSPADVPWLTSVTVQWGLELQLVNVSNSGLLIESRFRFTPGESVEIQLWGRTWSHNHLQPVRPAFVLPARIVRSHVGAAGGRGVRFQAAAAFKSRVNLPASSHL